ncbi:MAG: hypothetical protein BWY75_01590 [bacterium ADurb.Bin425]|nr:MAG: hypothetical protein BWY75_01590 [bacterium ADurb.Bin425]
MSIYKKILVLALVLTTALWAGIALAEEATSTEGAATSTEETVETTDLAAMIKEFQTLRAKLLKALIAEFNADKLNEKQVQLMQVLLASDFSIYPEGVITGKVGDFTRAAVKRYMQSQGWSVPARLLQVGAGKSGNVPAGLQKAPGIQKKLNLASGTPTTTAPAQRGFLNRLRNILR